MGILLMKMTVIFSSVEAQIATDFVTKFPNEFDFVSVLKKICEDSGVLIDMLTDPDKSQQMYTLKGLWLPMERAYQNLMVTLALHGSRPTDTMVTNFDVETDEFAEILDYSLTGLGDKVEEEKEKDTAPNQPCKESSVNKIVLPEDAKSKTRRKRKSAVQSRKFISSITRNEIYEDGDEDVETYKDNVDDKTIDSIINLDESAGKENYTKVFKEEKPYEVKLVTSRSTKSKCVDKPSVRKRGRPKKYHDEGVSEFQCSQCSFVAKDRAKLRSHTSRMHKSNPSSCDICHKVFPNKRYMLRHKASHVGPQHCCDVCGKMYKVKKTMIDHRKTHDSSYKKPSFQCSQCPKSFCTQYILDCHVRDIHEGLKKSFLCSVCGKSFTTKHSLTEHSNAHNGVKPYACDLCDKRFSYESALRDHKYSHLDSKQFWCKHCQKSFTQRSGLKMHMRTHRLHKLFTCSECGRGFSQKQALQRHERVHKGEKPYMCKHCGRFFTDASIVRRHLILVHKIEKGPKVWRDDIICTIVGKSSHYVQNVVEDEKIANIENQKEEILQKVGSQNLSKPIRKGPTRAFQRYFPRRVALLDDEDNVIAGPDISISTNVPLLDKSAKLASGMTSANSSVLHIKSMPPHSLTSTAVMESSDGRLEMDSTSQMLNQRFIDPNQWALTGHLSKGSATTQLESIILTESHQTDVVPRNLEQDPNLQKLIKCENVQTVTIETSPQEEYQATQNHTYSPVSFSPIVLTNNSKSLENQFETLPAQLNQTPSQYCDVRGTSHAAAIPLSSVYYYSHLTSQLGLNINSEFSYINSANSPATQVTSCIMQSSMDVPHISTSSNTVDKIFHQTGSEVSNISTNVIPPGLNSIASSCVTSDMSVMLDSNQLHGHNMVVKGSSDHSGSIILSAEQLPSITVTPDMNSSQSAKCDMAPDNLDHFLDK